MAWNTLSVVFKRLVRLGSFPACWRQAVSPQFRKVHCPPLLPITDQFPWHVNFLRCLSVLWLFVLDDLWNAVVCFQQQSVLIVKVWVPVMHFCAHTLQSAFESAEEARIMQIDFSAAFDRVNHQGIVYKLCSVGIGGSVLSILTQLLLKQSQHVMVDSCRSKLINVLSGVLCCRAVFWAHYCFSYTPRSFLISE